MKDFVEGKSTATGLTYNGAGGGVATVLTPDGEEHIGFYVSGGAGVSFSMGASVVTIVIAKNYE